MVNDFSSFERPIVISSNLGPISHLFRDMASFLLKNAHFSYPLPDLPVTLFTQNFKMLPLQCITQIL